MPGLHTVVYSGKQMHWSLALPSSNMTVPIEVTDYFLKSFKSFCFEIVRPVKNDTVTCICRL